MKYFIIGFHCSGKQEVVDTLIKNGIKCGKLFSNIEEPSDLVYNSRNYELYSNADITSIFENNAYIFINELSSLSHLSSYKYFEGLSKYTFDNNDVFVLSPDQLLCIPANVIDEEICFIWMDNNKEDRLNKYKKDGLEYGFSDREKIEKHDINSFVKTMYSFKNSRVLYFVREDPCRVATVIYSLIKHPELLDRFTKYYE